MLRLIGLTLIAPVAAHTYYLAESTSCQIYGDPDVYGLGIRLSYYLQWAAVALGSSIAPASAARTRAASNILTLSVLIASIYGSLEKDSLNSIEWYIVELLTFWLLLFNLPMSRAAARTARGSFFVTLCNYAIVLSYSVYISFYGYKMGFRSSCPSYVWLFRPIDASGHFWQSFCKAMTVVLIVGATTGLLVAVSKSRSCTSNSIIEESLVAKDDSSDERSVSRQRCGGRLIFHLGFGAIVIAIIEMTIMVNDVSFLQGQLSNGCQLTPLMLGIFSLVSAIWEIFTGSGEADDEGRTVR